MAGDYASLSSTPFKAMLMALQKPLSSEVGGKRSLTLSSAAALRLSAYFKTLRVPSAAATKFAPGHTSMPAQQRPAFVSSTPGQKRLKQAVTVVPQHLRQPPGSVTVLKLRRDYVAEL